jgi:outer membrane immunogenic protein
MKKLFLAGVAAAALAAGSANAADMPLKAAPVAMPAPWSWTGFYIGAHVGSAWATKDWLDPFSGKSVGSGTLNGFLGGFQAGLNYQIDRLVLGVEGDFSWADVSGIVSGGLFGAFGCGNFDACSSKAESFSTVTGRIGGTIPQIPLLLYVKGGAAWVRDKHNIRELGCTICESFSASETRTGWTWGTGLEYAFTANWSGKIEYDYMDFGTKTVSFCSDPDCGVDIRQRVHMVKAGVNYRFDWGNVLAPLATRY